MKWKNKLVSLMDDENIAHHMSNLRIYLCAFIQLNVSELTLYVEQLKLYFTEFNIFYFAV